MHPSLPPLCVSVSMNLYMYSVKKCQGSTEEQTVYLQTQMQMYLKKITLQYLDRKGIFNNESVKSLLPCNTHTITRMSIAI